MGLSSVAKIKRLDSSGQACEELEAAIGRSGKQICQYVFYTVYNFDFVVRFTWSFLFYLVGLSHSIWDTLASQVALVPPMLKVRVAVWAMSKYTEKRGKFILWEIKLLYRNRLESRNWDTCICFNKCCKCNHKVRSWHLLW